MFQVFVAELTWTWHIHSQPPPVPGYSQFFNLDVAENASLVSIPAIKASFMARNWSHPIITVSVALLCPHPSSAVTHSQEKKLSVADKHDLCFELSFFVPC